MALFHSPEFWVLVAFVVFVVLAGRPIARMISAALDQRAARIKATLDEAQKLRDEAQKLLADNQRLVSAWVRGNLASLVFLPANCFFFAIFPEIRDRVENNPGPRNTWARNQKSPSELSGPGSRPHFS